MQTDNGQVPHAPIAAQPDAELARQHVPTKQDLISQLQSANSNGSDGIFAQLTSNPFFTAGFGLAALGASAAVLQRGSRHAAALLRRRLLVDVEINVRDPSYEPFLYWMTLHHQRSVAAASTTTDTLTHAGPKPGIISRLLNRLTPGMHHLAIQSHKTSLPNGRYHMHSILIPGPGNHVLRYNNTFLWIKRVREARAFNTETGRPWETVTLTTLYAHRHIFESLFAEAHALAQQTVEGKTVIYNAWGVDWKPFGDPRRKRPLDSVILAEGIKERILADVRDFISAGKWYGDRGIPYRRGYLLHGPPGTGKSSFIQALAGELDYDIAMLNLSQRGLTDDKLMHLLMRIPPRTLVLLEDVDAAFGNRRSQIDADGYQGANVTMSGLLNALDGVASAEERIIFLTTNFVERLDEALIRPGRVDMTVRLGEATVYQVRHLWERFYGDVEGEKEYLVRFMQRLREVGVIKSEEANAETATSTAALQGVFVFNKGDPEGAIEMAWQLGAGRLHSSGPPKTIDVAEKT